MPFVSSLHRISLPGLGCSTHIAGARASRHALCVSLLAPPLPPSQAAPSLPTPSWTPSTSCTHSCCRGGGSWSSKMRPMRRSASACSRSRRQQHSRQKALPHILQQQRLLLLVPPRRLRRPLSALKRQRCLCSRPRQRRRRSRRLSPSRCLPHLATAAGTSSFGSSLPHSGETKFWWAARRLRRLLLYFFAYITPVS